MLKWTDANGHTHLANEQIFSRSQLLAMIRPKGYWIIDSGVSACSCCHVIWLHRTTNFCPNCGADMANEIARLKSMTGERWKQ